MIKTICKRNSQPLDERKIEPFEVEPFIDVGYTWRSCGCVSRIDHYIFIENEDTGLVSYIDLYDRRQIITPLYERLVSWAKQPALIDDIPAGFLSPETIHVARSIRSYYTRTHEYVDGRWRDEASSTSTIKLTSTGEQFRMQQFIFTNGSFIEYSNDLIKHKKAIAGNTMACLWGYCDLMLIGNDILTCPMVGVATMT